MTQAKVDVQKIKDHIRAYYTRLFQTGQRCSVPVAQGRQLAAVLNYPLADLDFIAEEQWDNFVPCGNPLPYMSPAAGERILNLGCGAAVDSFALAATGGGAIEIINLDVVFDVVRQGAEQHPPPGGCCSHLRWLCADGEALPLAADSFDWVILNGVLNLFPDKAAVLGEINRVLRPSGILVGADLCCAAPLPDYFVQEKDAWAWCMSGAVTTTSLVTLFRDAGFLRVETTPQESDAMFVRLIFVGSKQAFSEQV